MPGGRELDLQSGQLSRWRNPEGRSAKVILSFVDASKVSDAEKFRPGLPVVVVFEPRSSTRAAANEYKRVVENSQSIYETVRDRLVAAGAAWTVSDAGADRQREVAKRSAQRAPLPHSSQDQTRSNGVTAASFDGPTSRLDQ